MRDPDDDLMLRALVQLVEAQAQQIDVARQAVDELEARLRVRSEVDVLLAHEVRTPLTIVRGILHTLHQHDLTPGERADLVERALSHAVHLSDVVDDLLDPGGDPTALELPRARMRHLHLHDLLEQAVDAVSARLPRGRIDVRLDEEITIATAASRFIAIVVNLLENAAKYGGTAPVTVTARMNRDRVVVVEVADRGPGLAGADADELFGAFSRGTHAPGEPGRGVGLYVVRMLARSLGGDATLTDREGGGLVARVRLPQRRADDPAARLQDETQATPLHQPVAAPTTTP